MRNVSWKYEASHISLGCSQVRSLSESRLNLPGNTDMAPNSRWLLWLYVYSRDDLIIVITSVWKQTGLPFKAWVKAFWVPGCCSQHPALKTSHRSLLEDDRTCTRRRHHRMNAFHHRTLLPTPHNGSTGRARETSCPSPHLTLRHAMSGSYGPAHNVPSCLRDASQLPGQPRKPLADSEKTLDERTQ